MFSPGKFNVKVARTFLCVSTAGNDQIGVVFAQDDGSTIAAYLACTEKAWPYSEEKLRNIGWDPEAHGFLFEKLNEEPSPIAGNECQITVEQHEYQGKVSLKVAFINSGAPPVMTNTEAVSFGARLRGKLGVQAVKPVAKRSPRPPATRDPLPVQDDDEVNF